MPQRRRLFTIDTIASYSSLDCRRIADVGFVFREQILVRNEKKRDSLFLLIRLIAQLPEGFCQQSLNVFWNVRCVAIVNNLRRCGIIQPSRSQWAANIRMAKKKSGQWRMCIDYRDLNKRTVINDPYPLPRIDALLDTLGRPCVCLS